MHKQTLMWKLGGFALLMLLASAVLIHICMLTLNFDDEYGKDVYLQVNTVIV